MDSWEAVHKNKVWQLFLELFAANSCFSLAFYFKVNATALPHRSPQPGLSHCFPSGPQLQIFLPPYGPNPIMALP